MFFSLWEGSQVAEVSQVEMKDVLAAGMQE